MKLITSIIAMLSFLFSPPSMQAQPLQRAERKVERLFGRALRKPQVHHAFFSVYAPGRDLHWSYSGGQFADGSPVAAANPFHSASVGKTFTATLIMQLVEERQLGLQDTLGQLLPAEVIAGLHVWGGEDCTAQITVAQLLQHRSGLPDCFEDRPRSGMSLLEQMLAEPDYYWTPEAILDYSRTQLKARFAPGQGFHYSDAGYLLLGLIIEQKRDQSLSEALHEQIFQPLQLTQTSMHLRSRPITAYEGPMAELYVGEQEISGYQSLSADWAGGGLLTTTDDLLHFMEALRNGAIITEQSFEAMQQWVPESRGMEYGYGLRRFRLRGLFPLLPNLTLIGHSGSTNSFLYYCPELEVYLAGTFNQTSDIRQHVIFMVKVLSVLKKHGVSRP